MELLLSEAYRPDELCKQSRLRGRAGDLQGQLALLHRANQVHDTYGAIQFPQLQFVANESEQTMNEFMEVIEAMGEADLSDQFCEVLEEVNRELHLDAEYQDEKLSATDSGQQLLLVRETLKQIPQEMKAAVLDEMEADPSTPDAIRLLIIQERMELELRAADRIRSIHKMPVVMLTLMMVQIGRIT